jgi:hypothetical protein
LQLPTDERYPVFALTPEQKRRRLLVALSGWVLQPGVQPLVMVVEDLHWLTGKLAAIRRYNALRIMPELFFETMERLRGQYLNVPLAAVLHPPSLTAQTAATEQKAAAIEAPPVQQVELTAEQWFERGFCCCQSR